MLLDWKLVPSAQIGKYDTTSQNSKGLELGQLFLKVTPGLDKSELNGFWWEVFVTETDCLWYNIINEQIKNRAIFSFSDTDLTPPPSIYSVITVLVQYNIIPVATFSCYRLQS